MTTAINVKKIDLKSIKSLILGLWKMIMNFSWLLFVIFIVIMILFEILFKSEVFNAINTYVKILIVDMCSLFIFFLGSSINRNLETHKIDVKLMKIIPETSRDLLTYVLLKPIRLVLGVIGSVIIGYLLLNYKTELSMVQLDEHRVVIVSIVFFLLITGLLSMTSQIIFMYWDGCVKVPGKKGMRISKGKTDDLVKKYKAFNIQKNGVLNIVVQLLLFTVLILTSNSMGNELLIFLTGIVINQLYVRSFEQYEVLGVKTTSSTIIVNGEKIEEEEGDESDNDVEDVNKPPNKHQLTKEKILGEDWYLNDRKSVIEPEVEEVEGEENPDESV